MIRMPAHRVRRLAAALLACLLLGLIAFLHLWAPIPDAMETSDYPYQTSRHCGRCHREIYDQWRQSFHAKAWKDPLVRRLSNGFGNVDCMPCHAPRPVLEEGFGQSPRTRSQNRKEGVSCLSCHGLKRCVAIGRDAAKAPCRPVKDKRMQTVTLCQTCHNIHGTVDAWRASGLNQQGRDCLYCHMPLQDAENGQTRRSHAFQGGHAAEMVDRALDIKAWINDRILFVEVTNSGAGHNVPTELRHRALDLEVTLRSGWFRTRDKRYRFSNPYKSEGGPNTQLRPGETRRLQFGLPSAKGQARLQLIYRLMPEGADSQGTTIKELTMPFEAQGECPAAAIDAVCRNGHV